MNETTIPEEWSFQKGFKKGVEWSDAKHAEEVAKMRELATKFGEQASASEHEGEDQRTIIAVLTKLNKDQAAYITARKEEVAKKDAEIERLKEELRVSELLRKAENEGMSNHWWTAWKLSEIQLTAAREREEKFRSLLEQLIEHYPDDIPRAEIKDLLIIALFDASRAADGKEGA